MDRGRGGMDRGRGGMSRGRGGMDRGRSGMDRGRGGRDRGRGGMGRGGGGMDHGRGGMDRGHGGMDRGRGGMDRGRGGRGRGFGESKGMGRGGVNGFEEQSRKRAREPSPSRWHQEYDKPLPASILEKCTDSRCDVCSLPLNGPSVSRSHYDGKAHDKKVKKLLEEMFPEPGSAPKKRKVEDAVVKQEPSIGDGVTVVNTKLNHCEVCNVSCSTKQVYDTHLNGKGHASRLRASKMDLTGSNKSRCDICNVNVAMDQFQAHLNGKNHKKKEKRMAETGDQKLTCDVCSVTMTDLENFNKHMQGKRHMENVGEAAGHVSVLKKHRCEICQMDFSDDTAYTVHCVGDAHNLIVEKLGQPETSVKIIDYSKM